ncbi:MULTISPECIES: MFS transporter [unclassified Virgibacillus]|uniref:CynX/NimT family MFS transporter n=1 Tax=unclassified Virgibacillus TaxID=2620237 RepID=UPI0024DEA7EC|nr:MFS transporter [Virgibacillus sp. LDC-1]
MQLQNKQQRTKQWYRILLVVGIVFVSFNLRPAITSVGPLIRFIRDDLALSNWSAGLLTSLPLIAFALLSPVVPRLANRFSNEMLLLLGLIVLSVGISLRSIAVTFLLFGGTLLIGLGIAVCNVLLPGVIKDKFPTKVGIMTSIYSTSMGVLAATASGVSIPLAVNYGLGWQLSLLFWIIPAILGIPVWIYLLKKNGKEKSQGLRYVTTNDNRIWKSPLAWQVASFLGLQSFLFYVTVSWLPEILHNYGVDMATAGWMLSFCQFIGLPASFIVPMIAGKLKSQRGIVFVMTCISVGGYGGLLVGKSEITMVFSVILIGISLSGSFALALAFLGLRAKNAKQAAELSGMAQALGYILAAVGPIIIGFLFDITEAWTIPLIILISVSVFVMLFGFGAGRNKYVLDDE